MLMTCRSGVLMVAAAVVHLVPAILPIALRMEQARQHHKLKHNYRRCHLHNGLHRSRCRRMVKVTVVLVNPGHRALLRNR